MMNSARKAIEKLYKDRCSVIEKRNVTDPVTKKTDFEQVTVFENQPCKLSFSSFPSATDGNNATLSQAVKLFLSPDCSILPGSKIIVTQQNGTVTEYSNSGKPAIYASHQEINLKLFERWA